MELSEQSAFCSNAMYQTRIDDPDYYNFCVVPNSGSDGVLFAALAVLCTCLLHFSSFSAVWVLLAGAAWEALVLPFNLGRLSNAFALWLGIDPPQLFFFVFLPPILLDAALSIKWYSFLKLRHHILAYAFLIVVAGVVATPPFLLYVLHLNAAGWQWQHGALFASIVGATDALAISTVLHRAGGPEHTVTLLEGESLLNDASALTLFKLLHAAVIKAAEDGPGSSQPLSHLLPAFALDITTLSVGGAAFGLCIGVVAQRTLRMLRWHSASSAQETATILALAYLTYYIADEVLGVSGVIAVVVFGLYGNSQGHFSIGGTQREREARSVLTALSFALNGLAFFFAGASSVNFTVRASFTLRASSWNFAAFPLIFLALLAVRCATIFAINSVTRATGHTGMPLQELLFSSWAGLRGAISLIMAQAVVTDERIASGWSEGGVAQLCLWTAMMVLTSLFLSAPMVPQVLRMTGLHKVSPLKRRIRAKSKRALIRFTTEALEKLKCSDDEMLRGVDWAAVEQFVDLSDALPQFSEEEPQLQRTQDRSQQTATHATREREQQPGVRRPEAAPVDPKAMEAQQPSPHAPALPTVRTKVPSESSRSTYRPSPGLQSPHQSCPRMLGFRRVGVSEKWERAVQSPRAGPGGVDLDTPKHRLRLLSRRVHFADEEESSQGGTAFDPGVVDIEAPLLEEDGAREEAGREEHSAALFANGGQRVHDHHQLAPLPLAAFPSSTSLYSMASEAGLNFNQDSGAPSSGPYLAESSSTQGRLSTAVPATREVLQPTDVEGAEAPELPERWAEEGLGAPLGAVADQAQHHWGAGDSSHPLGLQVGANGASGWGASGMASSGGGAGGNGAGGSAGLMHHSLSIPLLPEASGAEKMEAQQEQPSQLNTLFPRLPKVLRRFESGGDSQGELLEKPSAGFSVASSLISTPEGSEAAGVWSPEVLAEARRRLLSGLKSYFAAKHADGFLTSEGLRRLAFVCDQAIDTSDAPLAVWSDLEKEAIGSWWLRLLSYLFIRIKHLSGRVPRSHKPYFLPALRWLSSKVGQQLSRASLVACETAVEVALALAWSPAAQWLREVEQAAPLQGEMAAELHRATTFIVDRELEAPDRFQAIQSYRAASAVLRQQSRFIDQLHTSGVLDAGERETLLAPVTQRTERLEIQGPTWTAPSVQQVLRSLPFLHHVPREVFDAVLERGTLKECFEGEVVWPGQPSTSPPTTPSSPFEMGSGASTGPHSHDVMIVIYGLVKSSFVDHKGELQEYYLGSGGVIGLLQALVGAPLPGTGLAIAQGDALHRGPVLFLIPAAVVRSIAAEAAAGDVALHQLEIDMYRVAGLYVVERLQTQVAAQVTAACCREAASNGEEVSIREGQRAARKAVAAVRHALRDARVVRLAAGAKHAQHGHIVVLQGSLVSGQAEGEEELQGPAVLPWLPSLLGTDKVSGRAPKLWAAGGSGAVLLVCPTEPRGAKRHPEDAEVGASDGGADEIVTMAPFSEVSRAAFGLPGDVIEAKLNDGRPVPAPDQSTAMDALPGGSDVIAAAAEQQQAEHMASQRLPLSASILHLEALKGTVHGQ